MAVRSIFTMSTRVPSRSFSARARISRMTRIAGPAAALPADVVRQTITPAEHGLRPTDELSSHQQPVGQQRALEALQFGLSAGPAHSHIFVAGPPGTGRSSIVMDQARRAMDGREKPDDWIIVNDFENPDIPLTFRLPAGQGALFQREIRALIETLHRTVPGALNSRDYRSRYQTILENAQDARRVHLDKLEAKAREIGIGVEDTDQALQLVPLLEDGKPMSPEQYSELTETDRKEIEERERSLRDDILVYVDKARVIQDKADNELDRLDRRTLTRAINPSLTKIRRKMRLTDAIKQFLKDLAEAIIEDPSYFLPQEIDNPLMPPPAPRTSGDRERFDVNLLVDNAALEEPPVIAEWHPTYANVIGRVERRMSFGAMETNHMLLRAGALIRASGGVLIMSANDLLSMPFVYQALKRALRDGQVSIEDPDEGSGIGGPSTITVRPAPIPIRVQVILIGSLEDWSVLTSLDEDFAKLFRIRADFGDTMPLDQSNIDSLCAYICDRVAAKSMLPVTADGIASLLEEAIRLAGRRDELTLQLAGLTDFLAEADIWARRRNRTRIDREDIDYADAQRRRRDGMFQEQILLQYQRGTILLDTSGERVGQVNGLAVISSGQFDYGLPVRITAKTFAGSEGVVNIERETELSGQIHSKAVLILSGYLGATYAQKRALSLSASITFEQNYNLIEGDSASVAEAVVLLSSLSGLPVRQDVAITGSMNQHGEVQPVGGINEKIEGFFHVCQARGLTGTQGVLIPSANIDELHVQPDVARAVAAGKFHIYAVSLLDHAVELLTGVPMGGTNKNGSFTAGSVHSRVAARIRQFADRDARPE
jgi:lon-related putative ATP-dependent protease